MKTQQTTVTISDVDIDVEYIYHMARRGAMDSFMGRAGAGPQIEPDEPAEIELHSKTIKGVDIFELLSDKQLELIEEQIFNEIREEERSYREDEI